MFWKKKEETKKTRNPRAQASRSGEEEFDISQFGIKPVSNKDVEAELAKLMADVKKQTISDDIDIGDGGSSDEEAQIMRIIQQIPDQRSFHGHNESFDSDGDVDVSDSDMDDPHLQAELNSILGVKKTKAPIQQVDERKRLEELILSEKQRTLQLKRDGRIKEALEAMRSMKAYEAQLQALPAEAPAPVSVAEVPRPRAGTIDEASIEVTDDDMANPEFDAILNGGSNQAKSSSSDAAKAESIRRQIEDLKKKAVEFKRNNNIQEALASLREVKALEKDLQDIEAKLSASTTAKPVPIVEPLPISPPIIQAEQITTVTTHEPTHEDEEDVEVTEEDMDDPSFDDELKRLHETPTKSIAPSATRSSSSHLIDEFDDDEEFHDAEVAPQPPAPSLEEQLESAKSLAIILKRQGRIPEALVQLRLVKELEIQLDPHINEKRRIAAFEVIERQLIEFGNQSRKEANELLQVDPTRSLARLNRFKAYAAALEILRGAKAIPNQPPPLTHIEEVTEMVEFTNTDVPLDKLELSIIQVRSTSTETRDLLVKVGLNVPSQNPHELSTPSVRGTTAFTFNTAAIFPIQRGRGLQKLCELRKASIEAFKAGGFWSAPESIGKASLPLSPLLKRSEIHCWVPLTVGRRPCGVDVQIRIRLHAPLDGKEMREVKSSMFVIDSYPPIPTIEPTPPPNVNPIEPKQTPPTRETHVETSIELPVENESNDDDPLSVDHIESYDVICDEIEKITKKLEGGGGNQTLSDRMDSLALKKQILEIDMQTGKLTLDMYLERLQNRLAQDNILARKLYKEGRKLDAAVVLHRVKLMKHEIESASAAPSE